MRLTTSFCLSEYFKNLTPFSITKSLILVCAISVFSSSTFAVEGYYSWPTANDNRLVFSAEGDLWRLDDGASQAIRLTSHDEVESQAVISPDGNNIAFAASFDGIAQVYIMPVSGGAPRQLTFESVPASVRGWSPDGRILYMSRNMEGASRVRELRLVTPSNGDIERIPLSYAATGTFDDSMSTLFFTRHGINTVGDSARLYRGGGMSQLWRFDMSANTEAQRLASDFEAPVESPMFWRSRIYFVSDKSGFDNIWSMNTDGNDIRQHSDFEGWRLQSPKQQNGTIHYQRGADIFAFDIATNSERPIAIDLVSDRDRTRLRWIDDPLEFITDAHMGCAGERVALSARGNVTVAGTDEVRRTDLPIPEGARARSSVPGPDGDWIYTIVDAGERGEIWRFSADGSGNGEQLTHDASDHRWRLNLSGDGKWLIHSDKSARLWKLNLETMENSLVMQTNSSRDDDFGDFSFSNDGRYLAFRTTGNRIMGSVVMVHDLNGDDNFQLTGDKYSSYSPAFSRDGMWLYFLSDRNFQATPSAPWGDRNMGSEFDKRTQIFALALTDSAIFPFSKLNEITSSLEGAENEEDEEDSIKIDAADSEPVVEVDWSSAILRLYQVPLSAGNYSQLIASKDRLFMLDAAGSNRALKSLSIDKKDPKLEVFSPRVSRYELSSDAEMVFLTIPGESPTMAIVPVGEKAPEELADYRLRVDGWRLPIDPANEWQQIFLDAWRLHRDFAFDSNMRGVDWEAVRDRLLPLSSRIGHRSDLSDLLAQMSFELGILHSQIRPGDMPDDDESGSLATLGARYALTNAGVEIVQIYQGESDRPETLGPLSGPDKNIEIGDIITSVNYQAVTSRADLEQALMHQAGEQLLLQTLRGAETIQNVVSPVTARAESMLRYLDWTGANFQKVAEATDGEIGYLHLRAMGGNDMSSFARDFFGQNHLDGLIVDVRDNNGGNIDSAIIQQFLRRAWAFWEFEPGGPSYANMQEAFRGHFAVLINAGTYSDGESFAAGVKALELAPLIGERTAGAGIWLSGRNQLSDGGMARIAENPQYGLDGRWLIEGYGIAPDIEVVAEPHTLFNGEDQQLTAAIEYLQQKIEDEPIPVLRGLPLPPMGERGKDVSN